MPCLGSVAVVKPRRIPAFNLNAALDRTIDEHPFTFGKYQGETPLSVAQKDPSYIVWVAETFAQNEVPFTQDLYELCKLTQSHRDYEAEDNPDLRELDGILGFHK